MRIVLMFLLALSWFCVVLPESSFAQDNINELALNINAHDYKRVGLGKRIGAEFGMGMLGLSVGLTGVWFSVVFLGPGAIPVIASVPALIGASVYLGGVVTGGRSSAGAPFAGAYTGSLLFSILGVALVDPFADLIEDLPAAAQITLFVLYGVLAVGLVLLWPILAFELSDSKNTDELIKKRDKMELNHQAISAMPEVPIVFSFSF